MKKLLTTATIIMAAASAAHAAQKCVAAADVSQITCTMKSATNYDVEWTATCYSKVNGSTTTLNITGMGVCASTQASSAADVSTTINTNGTSFNCWCKITAPFTTKWVVSSILNSTSFSQCQNKCADNCSDGIDHYSPLRTALFNNIITD